MRAEDVKVGAWVQFEQRWERIVGRVTGVGPESGKLEAIGGMVWDVTLAELEPWVPRVGEWVRFNDRSPGTKEPWRVDASSAELGATWYRGLDSGGGKYAAMEGFCEPCAPPDAKPAEYAGLKSGAVIAMERGLPMGSAFASDDAIIDALEAEIRKAQKRFDRTVFEVAEESRQALKYTPPARTTEAVASGERIAAMVKEEMAERLRLREEIMRGNAEAAKTRDHNATCSRCGGKAYQGLLNAQCVEPVCDDPETRMPDEVYECSVITPGDHAEDMWSAQGRGVGASHPLREGAIQAWREAVRSR